MPIRTNASEPTPEQMKQALLIELALSTDEGMTAPELRQHTQARLLSNGHTGVEAYTGVMTITGALRSFSRAGLALRTFTKHERNVRWSPSVALYVALDTMGVLDGEG
jgi:hypothetical protein